MQAGRGVTPPPGSMSEKPYSLFMDIYAASAAPICASMD